MIINTNHTASIYLPGYHLQGMIIHLLWLKISFSFIYKHLRKALLSNFRFKVGYLVEIFRFGCYNSKYRICRISWKKLADLEMFSWIRIGYRFSNSNIWKCFTKPWQFQNYNYHLDMDISVIFWDLNSWKINYEGDRDLEFCIT